MSTSLNSTPVVYFVTIATAVVHHRQTTISVTFRKFADFSLTNDKFPNFSGFSMWVMGIHPVA